MKIGFVACALLALTSLVANHAAAQTKGEMWEITTQMNIPGMPAGMGGQTQRLCQGDDPERAAAKDKNRENCTVKDRKQTANRTTLTMVCKDGTMLIDQQYNAARTEFKGTMKMTGKDGDMTMNTVGRKVGTCDVQEAKREMDQRAAAFKKQSDDANAAQAAGLKKMSDDEIQQCNAAVESMEVGRLGAQTACYKKTSKSCQDHARVFPEAAKVCGARTVEFCKRYQTQEGFLKTKSKEYVSEVCGVSAASINSAPIARSRRSRSRRRNALGATTRRRWAASTTPSARTTWRTRTSKRMAGHSPTTRPRLSGPRSAALRHPPPNRQRRPPERSPRRHRPGPTRCSRESTRGSTSSRESSAASGTEMRLRRLLVLAAALAANAAEAAPASADNPYPWIAAAYVVKRDGALLWAGQPDARLPPASLAKLMTALLALERGELEAPVTVGRGVLQATGTRIGLRPGEKLRAGDLLAATVVRSANDACRALAEHLGRTVDKFVVTMNERAAALGLANTRFADPCGHDREGQYASAADLLVLAEQVMRHDEYLRLARLERLTVRTLDGSRSFALRNTNALIGRYPGAIGLKTGYTEGAGTCLVALAERDGVRVLAVLLNAPNRWWNAVGLLDRAFAAPK
jgi:D-alanyl-D-alanine carboxypeptidase (penicillin-binding protein 5/6)